jgi:hypothetical protein
LFGSWGGCSQRRYREPKLHDSRWLSRCPPEQTKSSEADWPWQQAASAAQQLDQEIIIGVGLSNPFPRSEGRSSSIRW